MGCFYRFWEFCGMLLSIKWKNACLEKRENLRESFSRVVV